MAGGHGGDRVPNKPAAVSGPGSLSGRTDGQAQRIAAGGGYGQRREMEAIQSGAPMAESTGAPTPAPVPLTAPTQKPGEPVTAGAALGAGIGPEAAGILSDDAGTMQQLLPMLRSMETIANLPSSTPQFRSFVRKLRAKAAGESQ